MDDTTWLGSVGESKVASELSRHRFHVFIQTTGKAPFDLVVYKDGYLYRVNVKTTQRLDKWGSWEVQIKSVRSNRSKNRVVPFDPLSCDVLAVYIEPLDQVCFLRASEVSEKCSIALREKTVRQSKLPSISELSDPNRICVPVNNGILNNQTPDSNSSKTSIFSEPKNKSPKVSARKQNTSKSYSPGLAHKKRVQINSRKVERPSKEELQKLIWEIPTIHVAKKFGVSDKAIEKWCKAYEIGKPPRGYWAKHNKK